MSVLFCCCSGCDDVGVVEKMKHVASCCSIKVKVSVNSGYILLTVDLARGAKGRSFPRRVNGLNCPSCLGLCLEVGLYHSKLRIRIACGST